jgi:hypothetical protein
MGEQIFRPIFLPGGQAEDEEEWQAVPPQRVQARQRQVNIGKSRPEYLRYIERLPKEMRSQNEPRTPDPEAPVSKRTFDRYLSVWRRQLHLLDDATHEGEAQEKRAISLEASLGLPTPDLSPQASQGSSFSSEPDYVDFNELQSFRLGSPLDYLAPTKVTSFGCPQLVDLPPKRSYHKAHPDPNGFWDYIAPEL